MCHLFLSPKITWRVVLSHKGKEWHIWLYVRNTREPSYTWWECKLVQPLRKTLWRFLKKTKYRTTRWSSNPTPGHISRENHNSKRYMRASLVAQWLRICLPMQGTQVRALAWEDPTCRGATKPVRHNYWACASGASAPQRETLRQWEARAHRDEEWSPLTTTGESPRTETKTQHSQK